jgi:lipopolysaccharide/colanic/teichoic acid biosynthesis glycosyltransferase
MTRFRILIILLISWLVIVFNLERPELTILDINTNINLGVTFYLVSAGAALAGIAFPDLGRNYFTLAITTVLAYIVGMYLSGNPLTEQDLSLTITEVAMLLLTVGIIRQISLVLTRFEKTVEDVLLKPQDLRVMTKQVGEQTIIDELDRARYFGHPVGFVVLQLAKIMENVEDDSVHFDIEATLQRRYVQLRAAQVTRLLLPKVSIIVWDNEDMIICLPQSDEEMTFTAAYALNRELAVQLNLTMPMGMAIFSKDGFIYEDLIGHARNNRLIFAEDLLTDDNPVDTAKTVPSTAQREEAKKSRILRLPFLLSRIQNQIASIGNPIPTFAVDYLEQGGSQGKKAYNPNFWLYNIPPQSLGSRNVYQIFKRFLDIVLVVSSFPLLIPLLGLVAFIIKLEDGGSIFYTQERTGWGGHTFPMYKFRSMVPNSKDVLRKLAAQGLAKIDENANLTEPLKLERDPRVTRIGRIIRKTSIDELPQLLNVLKGDMSLVGPRPTSWKVSNYTLEQTGRLDVRPGLTGLWQITERGNTDFDVWLLWDRAYIERMCLTLDIQILIRTVGKIFARSGR